MPASVRCTRCLVTFLRGEDYLAHRDNGRCHPVRRAMVGALAVITAVVVPFELGRLAVAANADPGGAADWIRTAVAVVICAIGFRVAVHEMRHPR